MGHTESVQPLDPPREARRRFLKQIATTGVIAGAGALPAWAQEKPASASPPSSPAPASTAPSGPTVAETLARYATSLRYEDIPPDVVREAKRFLIDSIGCGLGGFGAEPSQIANRLAAGVSAQRGATVMCSGVKTSPDLAVFANGVMIRYLDFNDGYLSLRVGVVDRGHDGPQRQGPHHRHRAQLRGVLPDLRRLRQPRDRIGRFDDGRLRRGRRRRAYDGLDAA
jgi:MmgE/PrpD N-terminal domain